MKMNKTVSEQAPVFRSLLTCRHGRENQQCRCGNPIIKTYRTSINDDGRKVLVETGEENLYDKIQEHTEECKIYNILKRYYAGDLSALNAHQGIYADITGMPTNLIDAQKKTMEVQDTFMKLPAELRAEFGSDPNVFMAEMISGEAISKIKNFAENKQIEKPEIIKEAAAE